jgi:hypothetical protein
MQRLTVRPQITVPPKEKSLDELKKEAIGRFRPIIASVWPAEAPLQHFEVVLSPSETALNVTYASECPLDQISKEMILKSRQEKRALPDLILNAVCVPLPHNKAARGTRHSQ